MEEQIDIYYAFSALLGLVLGYLIKSFFEKEAAPAVKASAATKKGIQKYGEEEWKLRVELAAAYRISSFLGWDEIIYNHISVRIPGRNEFLINAFGLHYDEITASSLVKVNSKGQVIDEGTSGYGFNYAGFIIHGAIHEARDDVHCVFHTHDKDMQAISNIKTGLLPLSLESIQALALLSPEKHKCRGITTKLDEREALVKSLGKHNLLFLENHGTVACGGTIAEAFQNMFMLSRACTSQVVTMSTVGGDLSRIHTVDAKYVQSLESKARSNDIAQKGGGVSDVARHSRPFYAMMRKMERMDQSFKY
uniref:Class II aldolase/adducin N-terminal domain-containing protein n=1 Tax=Lotharella globosa TaxID=91324 RepID=A0A7S4DFE9_9EUKA|mmetsp:Transcript_2269/g.4502  ORF Transcript_2269/g.4502 Transcript_2269/m.4502 type:complete len:307 (+) Transcript_2269:50-970(+)|eukprot:CAMPEP_0167785910 /NCGR_PEP_ID=MMETSP0111_2-20121227/8487_1 /TAXON_ID=91324 /ORGANISM="Lotharella globosa, Strain CCCM811" /LENGTH=306 /DNA_ID=CAMNT_0007677209 /DNA_START=16 /DNA_END=936 /DNA_ORIENTATION=+